MNVFQFAKKKFVGQCNSTTYTMAKVFINILNSALPKYNYFIRNSIDLIQKQDKVIIPSDYIIISLDVTSLFTKIPVDLVLDCIEKRWPNIMKVTTSPSDKFKEGIKFLMYNTYFQFNNDFIDKLLEFP